MTTKKNGVSEGWEGVQIRGGRREGEGVVIIMRCRSLRIMEPRSPAKPRPAFRRPRKNRLHEARSAVLWHLTTAIATVSKRVINVASLERIRVIGNAQIVTHGQGWNHGE